MATLDVLRYARLWRGERAVRWENPKSAFANTPWSAAAEAIDITGALAVVVPSEGFVVISRAAHESDYEPALRVATFLMGQRDPSFRSRL